MQEATGNTCTDCFECTDKIAKQSTTSQEAAIAWMVSLTAAGLFPNMCRQKDDSFHVCHKVG